MEHPDPKVQLMFVASLALIGLCACSADVAKVDLCEVFEAPQKFYGRELSTEIVAIPNYHGWLAISFKCEDCVIGLTVTPADGGSGLRALEQKNEKISDQPGPPTGVLVHVIARIERVTYPRRTLTLRVLSAGEPTLVQFPDDFMQPPKGYDPAKDPPPPIRCSSR